MQNFLEDISVTGEKPSSGKIFQLVTDEWIQEGKIFLGSENRTALLRLNFENQFSFMTGFDCEKCNVKTYSSKESKTKNDPTNKGTSLTYMRFPSISGNDTISTFTGYWVRDRVCFNENVEDKSCMPNGFEFFVVTDTNEDKYFSNSIFSGRLGLGID